MHLVGKNPFSAYPASLTPIKNLLRQSILIKNNRPQNKTLPADLAPPCFFELESSPTPLGPF